MVVAVILDQFMTLSHETSQKDRQDDCFRKLGISSITSTPLEPLLSKLVHFQHPHDLDEKLSIIFAVLDKNMTGRLTPHDLAVGFTQLKTLDAGGNERDSRKKDAVTIHFSHEDFESFSDVS